MNLGKGVWGRRRKDGWDRAQAALLAKECQSPLEGELWGFLGLWVSEAPGKHPGLWRALPAGRGWLGPGMDSSEKPCHLLEVAARKGDTRGPFLFFLLTPRTGGGDTASNGKQQAHSKQADQ